MLKSLLLSLCLLALPAVGATAAIFTVTKTTDSQDGTCDADCSLREAVIAANASPGDDVVELVPGQTYTRSMFGPLFAGEPGAMLEVRSADPALRATISANHMDGVFYAASPLTLRNVVVADGSQFSGGGAVSVASGQALFLVNTVVENNTGSIGGIYASGGTVSLVDSEVRGNQATTGAASIQLVNGSSLTAIRSTIHGNRASSLAPHESILCVQSTIGLTNSTVSGETATTGGIFLSACSATLTHATFFGNGWDATVFDPFPGSLVITSSLFGSGCYLAASQLTLQGASLEQGASATCNVGDPDGISGSGTLAAVPNLDLAPLADNGGRTPTHLPNLTSPALDVAAADASCASVDQRDFARPANGSCDIGAVERDAVATAGLSINKSDGTASAVPGGSVTYTIVASNAGPSGAAGTTVTDVFPAALACTWTCAGAVDGTCTASGAGDIADGVDLPAGGSVSYTASCTIDPAATGTLANTATVTAPPGFTDPTPGNESATDSDALAPAADLSITKTDGVVTVTAGGAVTYTITASNAGPSNAPGATVADSFPAALGCTWTCVGAGGGTCSAAGSGDVADTANLPAGGSVTYTASCTLAASARGTLSNTATVAPPAGVTDPAPGNDAATDSDTIVPPPVIVSATKTVSSDGVVGGTVVYTIVLANTGTVAQSDNPGDELTDVLPSSLALVSASATSGTAVATIATRTVTWNGSIPAGGSVTVTITATILATAAGTTVANQGSYAFDGDANGTNEGSGTTDDPAIAGAADATEFVAARLSVVEIPSLSGVGLGLLATVLALAAAWLLRRRAA